MTRILMICLGNICRSPMAEGLMRKKIELFLLDAEVDSAGLSTYHIGESPDMRARMTMRAHNIDISDLSSRLFIVEDFDIFDRIYVMDEANYHEVISKARNETDKLIVDYLMNSSLPGQNIVIPDPYYGGQTGFEKVYKMLDEATTAIATSLANE